MGKVKGFEVGGCGRVRVDGREKVNLATVVGEESQG